LSFGQPSASSSSSTRVMSRRAMPRCWCAGDTAR
jgi:hypothetical protein